MLNNQLQNVKQKIWEENILDIYLKDMVIEIHEESTCNICILCINTKKNGENILLYSHYH